MRGKLLFVIVILALLLSGFAPATPAQNAAGQTTPSTVKLAFNNKTPERVSITLDGPAKYTFSLPPGKSRQMALPGRYRYAYTACKKQKRGSFDLKTGGGSFVIDKCPRQPVTPPDTYELVLDNKTGETLNIHLFGPETYFFTLQPGKTKKDVKPGHYGARYVACETFNRSGFDIQKDGTVFTLEICPRNMKFKSGKVLLKIKNDTGGLVLLKLVGPETYNLSFPAGNTSITIQRGKYSYTVTSCGGMTTTGVKQLGPHMGLRFTCEK